MAAPGKVTINEDGTARFETTCVFCEMPVAVDRLDVQVLNGYLNGEAAVQDLFPQLSASEREVLMSGSHGKCYDEAFPDEEA